MSILAILGFGIVPVFAAYLATMSGEEKRKALKDPPLTNWIYEDLPGAIRLARKEGKPLMVVFRCVP